MAILHNGKCQTDDINCKRFNENIFKRPTLDQLAVLDIPMVSKMAKELLNEI